MNPAQQAAGMLLMGTAVLLIQIFAYWAGKTTEQDELGQKWCCVPTFVIGLASGIAAAMGFIELINQTFKP